MGFVGVSLPRLKGVLVVSQLRSRGVVAFNVAVS